jgi:hypothetical protein
VLGHVVRMEDFGLPKNILLETGYEAKKMVDLK